MDVTDVDHITRRGGVDIDIRVERRLTLQHFNNADKFAAEFAPHNSDARMSDNAEWPPDLLFDVAYGCAAPRWWGEPTFIAFVQ